MKTAQICLHRIWFSGTNWVLPYLYGRLPKCSALTIGHVVPIYSTRAELEVRKQRGEAKLVFATPKLWIASLRSVFHKSDAPECFSF